MPIFKLTDEHIFPPPELAEKDGLLAIGGDLSESRLLLAYSMGIFPWYSEGSPILWWSPDPRLVLRPGEIKISRSLRQALKKEDYRITMDEAFVPVIRSCADIHRRKDRNTWITDDMSKAYIGLHRAGYAHSVEIWHAGTTLSGEAGLAGGLYGISLGSAFFGESMFTRKDNASKIAFVMLARRLEQWGFSLIDCQVRSAYLVSLGAREIPRSEFLKMLRAALKAPTKKGKWHMEDAAVPAQ